MPVLEEGISASGEKLLDNPVMIQCTGEGSHDRQVQNAVAARAKAGLEPHICSSIQKLQVEHPSCGPGFTGLRPCEAPLHITHRVGSAHTSLTISE